VNEHATALPEPPSSLAGRDYLRARDLNAQELDGLLGAWLRTVCHARVHSETGQAPQ